MSSRRLHAGLIVVALIVSSPALAQFAKSGVVLPPSLGGPSPAPPSGPAPDLAFGAFQRGYYSTALREAMKRLAADPKDGPAMTLIGEIYRDGVSVKADPAEAARWYRQAAATGFAPAQNQLGWLYANGLGVTQDDTVAADWFRRAADQGYAPAQSNLGELVYYGRGQKQDTEAAVAWFRAAAAGGLAHAREWLVKLGRATDGS